MAVGKSTDSGRVAGTHNRAIKSAKDALKTVAHTAAGQAHKKAAADTYQGTPLSAASSIESQGRNHR
jgi:hypothetical protein